MMKCFDEGLLQAYLDGELSPEMMNEAATHLAACPQCAQALLEAEDELSLFAAAFAPDMSLNIPTERLRERIDASIKSLAQSSETATKKGITESVREWFALLVGSLSLTPQRATAFASLIAVVAVAVILLLVQSQSPETDLAVKQVNNAPVPNKSNGKPGAGPTIEPSPTPEQKRSQIAQANKNERRNTSRHLSAKNAKAPSPIKERNPTTDEENTEERLLPGEENYIRAIASLAKAIEIGGDSVLKPEVRVDYERNLAVIDAAIKETRQIASRNPMNQDASEFLFAAYQNKIDLMATVADQAQIATLGR